MTDLASDIKKIQLEEVRYLDPQGSVYTRMGKTVNGLIDATTNQVLIGEVRTSILSEVDFQARRGGGWVIMKGQDITGSELNTLTGITELPNLLGKFVRSLDDGTGVDPDARTLGDEQTEDNEAHTHSTSSIGVSAPSAFLKDNDASRFNIGQTTFPGYEQRVTTTVMDRGQSSVNGQADNRPLNYSVNHFIRINT